jgi:cytochrome c oxidase subunit IV
VTAHPEATRRALRAAWRRNGLVWLLLLGLTAGSTAIAFVPLGPWSFRLNIGAALIAVVLVGLLSMDLDRAPTLDRLAAAAGLLFIVVMFTITFCDLFTRI